MILNTFQLTTGFIEATRLFVQIAEHRDWNAEEVEDLILSFMIVFLRNADQFNFWFLFIYSLYFYSFTATRLLISQ